MKADHKVDEKQFRIGEFARMAGVTVRTVRYYEELGLLGGSERRGSEHRRYTERDLLYLQRIQQLKSYDLTLSEIREITELAETDPSGEKRRLRLLARYRQKRREAQARREKLERYIAELDWHIEQLEGVRNFQDCPGRECERCRYTGICNFARPSSNPGPSAGR
jgi:DNA-binding transcriptional MerR regulator